MPGQLQKPGPKFVVKIQGKGKRCNIVVAPALLGFSGKLRQAVASSSQRQYFIGWVGRQGECRIVAYASAGACNNYVHFFITKIPKYFLAMKNKQRKLLVFGLLALLASCAPSFTRYAHEDARLTALPTRPHKKKVEVFFNNEIPTNRPYAKMEILETIVSSTNSDANSAIFQLQSQAQERGYDALIMLNTIGYATTPSFDGTTTAQMLADKYQALGIIFLDQIDYLDQCVKTQHVYAYNPGLKDFEPVGKLHLSPGNGPAKKEGSSSLVMLARYLSLDYLLNERHSNWIFSDWTDATYRLNIRRKQQYPNSTPVAEVHARYMPNRPDRLFDIRLRLLNRPLMTFTFVYDKEGRIIEKNIKSAEPELIKEVLKYNEKGVHTESHFYTIKKGKQEPLMQVINEFYNEKDLDQLLNQG